MTWCQAYKILENLKLGTDMLQKLNKALFIIQDLLFLLLQIMITYKYQ